MTYPRVLPESYEPNPQQLSAAIGQYIGRQRQQKFDTLAETEANTRVAGEQQRQQGVAGQLDYEKHIRPIEEALYKANAYHAGVRWPGATPADTGMPAGPQYSTDLTTTPSPAGPVSVPKIVDTSGRGGANAPPFSRPGMFNPQTGQHNPATPAPAPPPDLGNGFTYEDPARTMAGLYSGMGFSPSESMAGAKVPGVMEALLRNRGYQMFRETPEERATRESNNITQRGGQAMDLATAKASLRLNHDQILQRVKAQNGIEAKGAATMQQLLKFADDNYGDFAPADRRMTPDARYQLADELFKKQGKGGSGAGAFPPAQPAASAPEKPKRGLFGAVHDFFVGDGNSAAGGRPAEPQPPQSSPAGQPGVSGPGQAAPAPQSAAKRTITKDQRDFLISKGRWTPELYQVQ